MLKVKICLFHDGGHYEQVVPYFAIMIFCVLHQSRQKNKIPQ